MTRAIILVMDSVGIGETADAEEYGDVGANTLGHIAEACAKGNADSPERQGQLQLPNLARLGLGRAVLASSEKLFAGLNTSNESIIGSYGYAAEISKGKDTPSGHWEMAGLPVTYDWGVFPQTVPAFPSDFIDQFIKEAGIPGILGDKHASGTDILVELGDEHIRTGKPICYTSTDSVFQIAAHEEHFGLERLYHVCEVAKRLTLPLEIGRVIARPFVGDTPDTYQRTGNRHDYTTPPHGRTLLDYVIDTGSDVFSIGKIADIFAEKGISKRFKANGNMALFDATLEAMTQAKNGDLVFANFVDFDSLYGHRRDISGYATALEAFDKRLPELIDKLQDDDLLLITADHGCDPSLAGTDHTREHVPVLFYSKKHASKDLGKRQNFADMGQTIASHLGLKPLNYGTDCF